jgi:predicted AlkP superfamily phosphohydrolase/phosphomutase
MIVSDHGFESWRHEANVNVWLNRAGYLKLKGEVAAEASGPEAVRAVVDGLGDEAYFRYIDWEHTKAYSMGLGKIYLNLEGREPQGIVKPTDATALKAEIIEQLASWVDVRPGQASRRVCLQAWDALEVYEGPEGNITPFGDIVLGLGEGYRVSGSNSGGGYQSELFDTWGVGTNELTWSGDHAGNDPAIVKGIFLSNFKIPDAAYEPNLVNIAPTILDLHGVAVPAEWDGTPIPRK